MKQIPLSRGLFATVDDDMYDHLMQWKWHVVCNDGKWYAARKASRKTIYLHREIMGVTDRNIQVDHRDDDGLNCQRYNLRKCTGSQNMMNRGKQKNNTSGYKGVFLDKRRCTYFAGIRVQGKNKFFGSFTDPIEAARAYDARARELHGEFARLNFPEQE